MRGREPKTMPLPQLDPGGQPHGPKASRDEGTFGSRMADAPETPQGWTGEWRCCSISCGMNEEAVLGAVNAAKNFFFAGETGKTSPGPVDLNHGHSSRFSAERAVGLGREPAQ